VVRSDPVLRGGGRVRVVGRKGKGSAIALVGHEPNLGLLAADLSSGNAARPIPELKKGGAACLRVEGTLRPGSARLRWLLSPKVLLRPA
jgi:phosphohistidine phosphatase